MNTRASITTLPNRTIWIPATALLVACGGNPDAVRGDEDSVAGAGRTAITKSNSGGGAALTHSAVGMSPVNSSASSVASGGDGSNPSPSTQSVDWTMGGSIAVLSDPSPNASATPATDPSATVPSTNATVGGQANPALPSGGASSVNALGSSTSAVPTATSARSNGGSPSVQSTTPTSTRGGATGGTSLATGGTMRASLGTTASGGLAPLTGVPASGGSPKATTVRSGGAPSTSAIASGGRASTTPTTSIVSSGGTPRSTTTSTIATSGGLPGAGAAGGNATGGRPASITPGAGTASTLACPAAPAACLVGGVINLGTVCSGTRSVLTCGLDANGCPAILSELACEAPQKCLGVLPTAACGCPSEVVCDILGLLR